MDNKPLRTHKSYQVYYRLKNKYIEQDEDIKELIDKLIIFKLLSMSSIKYIEQLTRSSGGEFVGSQKYLLDEIQNSKSGIDTTESNKILVQDWGETSQREKEIDLLNFKTAYKNGPLFKYFLDGSRKAYKVADASYDDKPFPIIAGQSAVGCVEVK